MAKVQYYEASIFAYFITEWPCTLAPSSVPFLKLIQDQLQDLNLKLAILKHHIYHIFTLTRPPLLSHDHLPTRLPPCPKYVCTPYPRVDDDIVLLLATHTQQS